ncbi:MAG: hypothetical protein K2Y32_20830 [Candidatus Obscuribacterales bacterium]|nr:hypothetical protein [Candidatus Obscuribacterales bacterium]
MKLSSKVFSIALLPTVALAFLTMPYTTAKETKGSQGKTTQTLDLTGSYQMRSGKSSGLLLLKKIAGAKYRFLLNSTWEGENPGQVNTGESAGIINCKNGTASHQEEGFKLFFNFNKGVCEIKCDNPQAFGGINVNPEGSYRLSSNKEPSEAEFME